MTKLNVVVDENIAGLEYFFADIAQLKPVNGRAIQKNQLLAADALLVRSVTAVNADLLQGSKVKYVGSATIGQDHIDANYLQQREIQWATAPGCNAHAVVDYVLTALLTKVVNFDISELSKKTIGIVGCGNVGRRLQQRFRQLGCQVLVSDPPLERQNKDQSINFAPLTRVLQQDIICLHAPLVSSGETPTLHLLSETELAYLKPDSVLLNAGRGPVIETSSLLKRFHEINFTALLDVFEFEPEISTMLLDTVSIATPHIAGYSWAGKLRGSQAIYDSFCDCFGLPKTKDYRQLLAPARVFDFATGGGVKELLLSSYDIAQDDRRLRDVFAAGEGAIGFDLMRKEYKVRPEFSEIQVLNCPCKKLAQQLRALNFAVV